MALSTKLTSFNTGTGVAGTTIDVTLGFQPRAVILWWNGRTETTDAVARANAHIGYGFATDDTHRSCVSSARLNANTAEDASCTTRDDSVVFRLTPAGVANGALDVRPVANWPADGISFIVDTQFGASMRVHLLAIGGSDITDADVGGFAASASVGVDTDVVVNGAFQPSVVFFLQAHRTVINTIATSSANISLGVGISGAKQAVHALGVDDGSGSGDSGCYNGEGFECSAVLGDGAPDTTIERLAFVQMNADGFRVNTVKNSGGGSRLLGYLALAGSSWDIGSLLTQTDTTTESTVSGLAFQPAAIVFASGARDEATADAGSLPSRATVGAATSSTEQAAMAETGTQGSANTRVGTAVEHDAIYVNLLEAGADGDPQTIQGSMKLNSVQADGFKTIMTDADPAQSFVWWVAVGSAAAAGFDPSANPSWRAQTPEPIRRLGQMIPSGILPGRRPSSLAA